MEQRAMLALDMGASNGRVVWGMWEQDRLAMRELHRFENVPIERDGLMCWDIDRLLGDIRAGMRKCAEVGLRFDSVGLCSWGNTIGALDAQGSLLLPPLHYREPATDAALEGLYRIMDRRALFERTLFVPMSIQPSVVLRYLMERYPRQMGEAKQILMISDLMNYLLCGVARSERTMAATSGMVDMRSGEWDRELMERIGLRRDWFPGMASSGTPLGPLRDEFMRELGWAKAPMVVAVSGHDTASAAGTMPACDAANSLYLSCGTWSCMGCRVDAPVEGKAIFRSGATNDLGIFGEKHLRFNHTGLWILQECRRWWNARGAKLSHADLAARAAESPAFIAVIDTEDSSFFAPGDMPAKVAQFCRTTGQRIPEGPSEIARVVLESLALRYRYSAEVLSRLSGVRFETMRLMGGGARNALLCQMSADALGLRVLAGPTEASTIGNMIQQGLATGTLESRERACEILRRQGEIACFAPQGATGWDAQYAKALQICGWKDIDC